MGCMIRIATWPARTIRGFALDLLLGKNELPKDYVSPTVRKIMDGPA
jgi:hypothetical protein